MRSREEEAEELRLDIATVRALIDLALDRGVTGRDHLLQACASVLYQRCMRLEELEACGPADA